ncbi:MAG: DNA polymerase/3'-5' exonuclease PolX [Actinobacteria bacterium]|nr:DNA polymerase/3'-5' exonuclease PolX [Actinomycetota bacterium]
MHNVEIAWAFYELADLLEFKGEDFFKIRAYRQAARTIAALDDPVEELYRRKTLIRIPGLGKNIVSKAGELVEKGKMEKLEKLRTEIPPGLLEIMALPGIGPKRAAFLYEKLGVKSLDDLEKAARERKVRFLKGMGAKTELDIINNINMIKKRSGQFLLGVARELALDLSRYLKGRPGVSGVEVSGSVRRWRETVEDVDLLAACRQFGPVLDSLAYHPRTREIIDRGDNYIKVMTWWGIPVELVTVDPDNFWHALLWETGSEGHLKELSRHALANNWEFTREGMRLKSGETPAGGPPSEEEIYSRLSLKYVPPELREGAGEVESALSGKLPRLVSTGDIRGDLHMHSRWSDGAAEIEDIAARAREKGYSYAAITDHSRSLKIAGGLTAERLAEQYELIDRLNEKNDGFRILKGIEVDILAGGGLDFEDEILERADVVVASVHSGFRQDRETITGRILEAVENPHVDILGHLTGRLLGHREGYAVDVERVLEEAGRRGKIMEINASPDRLDLNEKHARMAVECGARIAINTDAHDLKRMDEMEYGVSVARRAGLEPRHIVNTLGLEDLLKVLENGSS